MAENIYFDNAATTFPKPEQVIAAVSDAIRTCGNPGRGTHFYSERAAELVYSVREEAASLFGAKAENVVFTPNATVALNEAVKGLWQPNATYYLDSFAHNAARRPILSLVEEGKAKIRIYDGIHPLPSLERALDEASPHEYPIVVLTHASNVCSHVAPLKGIAQFCRRRSIPLIVDASQSAGHIPISVKDYGITALCMPGHKGLYGIMGSGMLISSPDAEYRTLIEGGAGIASLDTGMPEMLPERLEAGTMSLPAIASLGEGIRFVRRIGEKRIAHKLASLSERFSSKLGQISGITLHGDSNGGIVSFSSNRFSVAELSEKCADNGFALRGGYHCAPLAHETLGTEKEGTVRVSFSYFNNPVEVDEFTRFLSSLMRTK